MMSGRLSGKVCVITGTGGSVGRAAALAFAREGASVVGCDVNVAAPEAGRSRRARVRADRRAVQQAGVIFLVFGLNGFLNFIPAQTAW
jgi:NAD(P)-dependent dehydrogenase (short-subunit alcohol dehydrogenase family)